MDVGWQEPSDALLTAFSLVLYVASTYFEATYFDLCFKNALWVLEIATTSGLLFLYVQRLLMSASPLKLARTPEMVLDFTTSGPVLGFLVLTPNTKLARALRALRVLRMYALAAELSVQPVTRKVLVNGLMLFSVIYSAVCCFPGFVHDHLDLVILGGAAASTAATAIALQQLAEEGIWIGDWFGKAAGSENAKLPLPLSAEAQRTEVVRVRGLLSTKEIDALHTMHAKLKPRLGSTGRHSNNQAAAYCSGCWETSYLSTDGWFGRAMPELRQKLISTAREVDAQHWQLLRTATAPVVPRCVEYHTVDAGGSLPFPTHYDTGSLVTIDVMCSDPSEFEGGKFGTLEADGTVRYYPFEKGDALCFVSHKYHHVQPVTAGRRHVLVMELWEGEERSCAHRCERHTGHCGHTVGASFWRRKLSAYLRIGAVRT